MPDEINWDDPDAVAAARGDGAAAPVVEDKKTEVDADAVGDTKKQEDEAAAEKTAADAKAAKAGDAKPDADTEKDDKEPLIPKSRFDAKNKLLEKERERNEELENRLAEADRRDAKSTKDDAVNQQAQRMAVLNDTVSELDEKINDALADGNRKVANQLRQEQRNIERDIMRVEMADTAVDTKNQTVEEMRLDMTIDQVEEMYPQLDPQAEGYDGAIVTAVQELRGGFMATGKYTASQALLKAVAVYIPEDVRIREAPALDAETEAQKQAKQAQKEAGLKKSTEAAAKQPPDLKAVGEDADSAGIKGEVDGSKLTLDDLERMPMDQLHKLRGDFL